MIGKVSDFVCWREKKRDPREVGGGGGVGGEQKSMPKTNCPTENKGVG